MTNFEDLDPAMLAGLVTTGKKLLEDEGTTLDLELIKDFFDSLEDDTPVSPEENNQETHNDQEERNDGS